MSEFRDDLTRAALEDPDDTMPWLKCTDEEFNRYVQFLRDDPLSVVRCATRRDGIDIEDVIAAITVKRMMVKAEKGTKH